MKRSLLFALALASLPLGSAWAEPSGTISGRITDAEGAPLPWITVSITHRGGSWVASDATSDDGSYQIDGLEDGDYVVHFEDPERRFAEEWWNDQPEWYNADPVWIIDGAQVREIDASLALMGSITGTVVDGASGLPAEACVTATSIQEHTGARVHTSVDGRYEMDLAHGLYTVRFEDCSVEPRLLPEWYDDARWIDDAAVIEILPGGVTSEIDAVLDPGGTISGTVTDRRGAPLADVCVEAHDATGDSWDGSTSGSGGYTIGPLYDGDYRLRFVDCGGRGLLEQWFSGKDDILTADPLAVRDAAPVTGVDVQLFEGGAIEGEISVSSGAAPLDACAFVYDLEQRYVAQSATDAAGNYRVQGLRSGDYKVRFGSCDHPFLLVSEWWNDQESFEGAAIIRVEAAGTVGGIDAVLARFAHISGRIFRLHGGPLEETCRVTAFTTDGRHVASTDGWSATYTLTLPAGVYKVQAWCNGGYLPIWFEDADTIEDASAIELAEGDHREGTDFIVCDPTIDTDADGLSDCREHRLGTDRTWPDTDRDGLTDGDEVGVHHTDPLDVDTDNDAFTDGVEVNGGSCAGLPTLHPSNPRDARSTPYTNLTHGFGQGPAGLPTVC